MESLIRNSLYSFPNKHTTNAREQANEDNNSPFGEGGDSKLCEDRVAI